MSYGNIPGGRQPTAGPQSSAPRELSRRPNLATDGTEKGTMAPPSGSFTYQGPMTAMAVPESARAFNPLPGPEQGSTVRMPYGNKLPQGAEGGALYKALMGSGNSNFGSGANVY
jgi:hypothetical protein